MRIIKPRKPSEEKRIICNKCKSELAYVKKDIHTYWSKWTRIGVESSERIGYEYIDCPICHHVIKIRDLIDKY